jgi:hypothetical protein
MNKLILPPSESLYDWRFTANQSCLATIPFETHDHILFYQLHICDYSPYVTSPLTKRMGLSFTIAAGLASGVILMSESRGTHDQLLLSQIRDSPNLDGQIPVFISPRNRVSRLYPQTLGLFSSPPTTRRVTVEVFDPASTRSDISLTLLPLS